MSKDNNLLSNLTDWIIPTFHPEDPTATPLPVSIPSLNYTFVLDSPCSLSLREREDSLIFQQATKDALSEIYEEYFGSHGRAKFQNMSLQLQTWDLSLPSFSKKSTRRIQRTRKYYTPLPQTNLHLGYIGEALFQYSPPPNEQLLQAVNEHLLSSPQLLTQMGQTIVQQLIQTHNTSNNNSFCANNTPFQILTLYTNTTPIVLPSMEASQNTTSTGIDTHHMNTNSSSTQIETLGADQTTTTSIGSTDSPFAETNSILPSTEDLTTTTTTTNNNNNSNTPMNQNNGTTTTAQTTTTTQTTSLIVGIAVFSSILLIIGLGFLYAFIQKRKRLSRKQQQHHDYNHEEDRATSVIRDDDDDDRSIEEAAEFFYNHADLYYSPQEEQQQQQPTLPASMTKNTNSLLSPTTTTAAAVLLASKSTTPKNTTTTTTSRMYNQASATAAARLDEYDICARSTYTLESEQQQSPSLGPQSLAESIPLEDILNTQSNNNNNNNNTTIHHYANQSVQLETIIKSLTSTTSAVPPPSATVVPPTTLTPAVLLPVSSTTLKKTVSFSEPEQPHEKKLKSPSYSATSSSLLSSYNITNESSWRFTQPSRFVGDEPNTDLPMETTKNHEEEGEVSLAESSLCMSKQDLIDLIGVARNKSKEEDYALHRLFTAKQSFVQTT